MQRIPVQRGGMAAGELWVENGPGGTEFRLCCRGSGLCSLWLVGTEGQLRLGIPESAGGHLTFHRRFSTALTQPVGLLLRGELRESGEQRTEWKDAARPSALFHTPWLQQALEGRSGVLTRTENGLRLLALPRDDRQPFPLVPLFCFACPRIIRGQACLVFAFDRQERPCFPAGSGGG